MKISIAIFAWNEEHQISDTIVSLSHQSVFSSRHECFPEIAWDIFVVANGCTDKTASVAKESLNRQFGSIEPNRIKVDVLEITEAGKSNAWNRVVHEFSSDDTDMFVMMDSDIIFDQRHTVFNCIKLLIDDSSCWVAIDKPLKCFSKKKRLSLMDRFSLRHSNEVLERDVAISGHFYCARSQILRSIWMPKGLPVEDGFLKGMIVTNCFRAEGELSRIKRAKEASHYYEGISGIRELFRHEVRLAVGTAINCYLLWDFLKFATDPAGPGGGYVIKSWLERDPDRFRQYIVNTIYCRGFWVLPRGMIFRRIAPLLSSPSFSSAKKLPFSLLAFSFDLLVLASANKKLKSGGAIGYW